MNFIRHSNLEGLHAYLGASQHSWLNYSDEKMRETYFNNLVKERGTRLHELAERLINEGIKLPRTQQTLNMYVNDAIGFKMTPEVVLYYSDNCFGTADTISFKKNFLRIHDLKVGVSEKIKPESHFTQLQIYSALFCLEYEIKPEDIEIENRIYKFNEVHISNPDASLIRELMNKIIHADEIIKQVKKESQ